jgi:hypothetical protein
MRFVPLSFPRLVAGRRAALLLATAAALATVAISCKDSVEAVPDPGRDYYPVAVGNYWIYVVTDTIYSPVSLPGQVSVATVSSYQTRELVTETFSDAAGQPVYRLAPPQRAQSAAAWLTDSIFVLKATPQSVILTRNNTPTIELIFPVRAGRSWNFNAFNNSYNDTITAQTRQYSAVGQAFTNSGIAGLPAITYPTTATTNNTGMAAESSLLRRVSYQQVFAKGIGPVFRRRANFSFFNYTDFNGIQRFPPGAYFNAATRRETLIDYHLQ